MRADGHQILAISLAILLAGCATTTTGSAGPPDPSAVASAITESGLRARLDALVAVSSGPGFRSVGAPGYAAAADLVATELRAAGWTVTEDTFITPAFSDPDGSELIVGGQTFAVGDIAPLIFAPAGDVTGPVVAVDWDAPEPTAKGCVAADYGDLPDGAIVLVPKGTCIRRDQVLAAQQAGAAAFVAGYPQIVHGDVIRPTLIDPANLDIPAVAATRPVGDALATAAAAGSTARLVTRSSTAPAATRSILAELEGSEPGAVVMLGAHLDSVIDGPGINDNGSGVAALLEIARAFGGTRPRATIGLAFWACEEPGLKGSPRYVEGLSASDRDAIVAYLNADMAASPNGFAGVYQEPGAPAGSSAISDLLSAAIERAGGVPSAVDLTRGSDHYPFGQTGIPTGGVFSGALDVVTEEQATSTGATAGQPADPCYHQACDDGSDLDLRLARLLTAALAEVTLQLADDPSLRPDYR